MKKQNSTKATVRTPIEKLKGKETVEHYNAVLLEDIKSKMELVLEGMDSAKTTLKDEMKNLEERLTQEIELLKTVVHKHSSDIKMESLHLEMIRNNTKENNLQVVEVNKRLGNFQNEIKQEMQAIGTRLCDEIKKSEKRLTERIDKVGDAVELHETKIDALETARL